MLLLYENCGICKAAEKFADIKSGERHLLTLILYEKLPVK